MNAEPSSPQPAPREASAPSAAARLASLLPLAGVVLLGAVAYANALHGAFVFDDVKHVRDNVALRDLSTLLTWTGFTAFPHRFVAYVTFALDYRIGGPSPVGYHATNVAVHLANAALVYALVVLAFRAPRLAGSALAPHARALAFAAAAIFVAHPIQTQAVTYVVQRMTSLATFFYLSAVVLWTWWRLAGQSAPRAARALRYAGVLAAAGLAMFTKEIAVTLPAALALVELALFETTRRRVLALLPVLALALLVPLAWVAASHAAPPAALPVADTATATRVQSALSRLDYLATELAVVVTYLSLVLLPVGQTIDHDYPIHRSFLAPEVLSALAVFFALAGLAAFLLFRTRRAAPRPLDPAARLAALGILWWFVALSVESSVIPIVDVINEHRVYLPSAGLFVAAAVGIAFAARRLAGAAAAGRRTAAAGAIVAFCLVPATIARNRVWSTEVSLWTDAALKAPMKSRPFLDLGTALREAGRTSGAIAALRRGVELDPDSAYGHAQLGALLLSVGQVEDGERELRAALGLAPRDPEALFNLATVLWQTGRADEARPLYARFVEVAPAAYAAARTVAEARTSTQPSPVSAPGPSPAR